MTTVTYCKNIAPDNALPTRGRMFSDYWISISQNYKLCLAIDTSIYEAQETAIYQEDYDNPVLVGKVIGSKFERIQLIMPHPLINKHGNFPYRHYNILYFCECKQAFKALPD